MLNLPGIRGDPVCGIAFVVSALVHISNKHNLEVIMIYREMTQTESEKLQMIDATCHIKNAWRMVSGTLKLVEINFTDNDLPNGLQWHKDRFVKTIADGGKAFGCFENDVLVGFATVNRRVFGTSSKQVLLDQLFVSQNYRNKGIGKKLFHLCASGAKVFGADKLYLCAGSAENTIAFYKKLGCVSAAEVDKALYAEDPNDIQLEFSI